MFRLSKKICIFAQVTYTSNSMKRKVSYIIIGILVIVIAVIATCNIIVNNNAKGRVFDNPADVPAMKTAVLLGTSPKSRYTGGPNQFFQARINAAIELYKYHKYKQLIISGEKRTGYDEPSAMKRCLTERGVPANIIHMDGSGHRTFLSMRNIQKDYHADSIIIISQKWHNQRSIYLADHLGIYAVGYNAEDVHNFFAQLTHIRELLARVKLFKDVLH